MSLSEVFRFYDELGSLPQLRERLTEQSDPETGKVERSVLVEAARANGFEVTAEDLAKYSEVRPSIVLVKPFRDRVNADSALQARLEEILGGTSAEAESSALCAAYLELAGELGEAIDREAMATAVRVENLLAVESARSLSNDDLESVAGGMARERVGAGRRAMIVQAYPATEYDFVPSYLDVSKE